MNFDWEGKGSEIEIQFNSKFKNTVTAITIRTGTGTIITLPPQHYNTNNSLNQILLRLSFTSQRFCSRCLYLKQNIYSYLITSTYTHTNTVLPTTVLPLTPAHTAMDGKGRGRGTKTTAAKVSAKPTNKKATSTGASTAKKGKQSDESSFDFAGDTGFAAENDTSIFDFNGEIGGEEFGEFSMNSHEITGTSVNTASNGDNDEYGMMMPMSGVESSFDGNNFNDLNIGDNNDDFGLSAMSTSSKWARTGSNSSTHSNANANSTRTQALPKKPAQSFGLQRTGSNDLSRIHFGSDNDEEDQTAKLMQQLRKIHVSHRDSTAVLTDFQFYSSNITNHHHFILRFAAHMYGVRANSLSAFVAIQSKQEAEACYLHGRRDQ